MVKKAEHACLGVLVKVVDPLSHWLVTRGGAGSLEPRTIFSARSSIGMLSLRLVSLTYSLTSRAEIKAKKRTRDQNKCTINAPNSEYTALLSLWTII
jgi:hypothetical protein